MRKHRKFKEQYVKEKKDSKKVVYTWIIAFLMVFSIIGFTIMESSQQSKTYNGFTFKLKDNKWITKVGKQDFSFYFLPSEVDYLNEEKINFKNSKMVYITFDPNQKYLRAIDLARYELANDFFNLEIHTVHGTTLPSSYNLPIIDCLNATVFVPVIKFQESNETKFSVENNCIILNSDSEEGFLKLKDLLLYKTLNIVK